MEPKAKMVIPNIGKTESPRRPTYHGTLDVQNDVDEIFNMQGIPRACQSEAKNKRDKDIRQKDIGKRSADYFSNMETKNVRK